MLMAVGYQESNFAARQQIGGGPARGFWMFEMGGVLAVITPRSIRIPLNAALEALRYPSGPQIPQTYYDAIRHNDVLAAVFARLLLWLHPLPMPSREDVDGALAIYLRQWRPGRPRPDDWASSWTIAGVVAAMAVDFHAFISWQSWKDAKTYAWGTATFRWFVGAASGFVTGLGLGWV
jgi:hypothetical protein